MRTDEQWYPGHLHDLTDAECRELLAENRVGRVAWCEDGAPVVLHAAPVFLPLIGAIIAGFFGRFLGDRGSQLVTCGAMVLAAITGAYVFVDVALLGHVRVVEIASWIVSGSFDVGMN